MRIRLVVQRYGPELLGGAERHAALMAGLLAPHHDVEVWTTTAGDYHQWARAYPAGPGEVEGVRVRRFEITRGRAPGWSVLSELLHDGFEAAAFARLPPAIRNAFAARVRAWPEPLQEQFIRGQGPIAPELVSELAAGDFDRVLFVTYLYPTTYDGLAVVDPARARVVPTLHDEPPAYLPAFGRRLGRATLLCSTDSERQLVRRLYPDQSIETRLLGYGIDVPPDLPPDDRTRDPFLLYAGRVDPQKGSLELLDWYAALRRVDPDPPRLVLIGESPSSLPRLPGLEARGFVDEKTKRALMRRALAFVHPSPYESLGIVALEAMAARTPLLVNAATDALVEHCRRGKAGLWVRDGAEFCLAVDRLRRSPELAGTLGAAGRRYVTEEYSLAAYERRLLGEFPPS